MGSNTRWPLRLGYVGVLALATLTPPVFQLDWGQVGARLAHAFTFAYTPRDAVDAVRNTALFGGWGALWIITAAGSGLAVRPAVLSGLSLSLGLELVQLVMPDRTTSVLDVFTNTAGSLLGAWLIVALVRSTAARQGRKSYLGVPVHLFAAGYLVAASTDAVFAPLRLQYVPGVYGGPITRIQAVLADFEWSSLWAVPVEDVVLYLPLGVLAVAALVELGWPYVNAARLCVVVGAVWWSVVELVHGPLALPLELGAIVGHILALALGAWLAVRFMPRFTQAFRAPARPLLVALAYGMLLLLWAWRPFVIETDPAALLAQLAPSHWIPLQAQAPQVDVFGVADIVEGFAFYLPLGALLAVWPLRTRGWLAGCWSAIYLGAVAELGQVLIAGRYFDMTDLLVQFAGAAMGWSIARRAGFAAYGQMLQRVE